MTGLPVLFVDSYNHCNFFNLCSCHYRSAWLQRRTVDENLLRGKSPVVWGKQSPGIAPIFSHLL